MRPSAFESFAQYWSFYARSIELWWTRYGGGTSPRLVQRRFTELVAFARHRSPFYREHYAGLPHEIATPARLPRVTKRQLMARFDDWVTDPGVRLGDVKCFLADGRNIGARFRGRYAVWKSSGTSGTPGFYVQDAAAMAVYGALVAASFEAAAPSVELATRFLSAKGRAALIVATGDHYASVTSWEHVRRAHPALEAKCFSVLTPLDRLVGELNAYQPACVASYPSMLGLLALEQRAGRLRIRPAVMWSGGEFMAPAPRALIERAFGCGVRNEYGASECLSIAYGCDAGWLHMNSEWVMLEGVDAHGEPVRPGELSHTTLLTNLANRVQPIIRYDLGDRMVLREGRCDCGNLAPAFRVEGRSDDGVRLRSPRGRVVQLPPIALPTVVEEASGVHRIQIAQIAPDHLVLRFEGRRGRAAAWKRAAPALRHYLDAQGLPNVLLSLDRKPPTPDARSGKLRSVIVEPSRRA